MSVRLHTPAQADSVSAAASHQIDGLVAATCQILQSAGVGWTLESEPLSSSQRHEPVDSIADIQIALGSTANPPPAAVIIRPRFPGSLIHHGIELIDGSTRSSAGLRNTLKLSEADHYGSFAPLPTALLDSSGLSTTNRKPGHHLLYVVAASASEETSFQQDIENLCSVVLQLGTVSGLTVIPGPDVYGCDQRHSDEIRSELTTITQSVTQRLSIPVFTPSLNSKDEPCLPAFMAKFDMALFAGCQRYVDAVQLGVPAYAWRLDYSVAEFNSWVKTVTQEDWTTLKSRVIQQQRKIVGQSNVSIGSIIIDNNKSQFESALLECLRPRVEPTSSLATELDQYTQSVIAPYTAHYPGSQNHQARHLVSKTHRKLSKFRQSPTRFLRDSDSALAKLVHPFLRDPAA